MACCWTCGASVESNSFTCNSCKQLDAHERTRSAVEEAGAETSARLEEINQNLLGGFDRLTNVAGEISDKLSGIASTLEWGFDAVVWQLQKQDRTLRSIDQTLKTPTATQANEWREIADGLANRRAFSQSKEFYVKAMSAYPLDYRTYLGLASTYLKLEKFDLATETLEQSLPHAPADGGFDWRSHSYRLLGHIQACSENYKNAAQLLGLAVSLSPNSVEANYDYSLYCAHTGDNASVCKSLAFAIEKCPKYWRTSAVARDFRSIQALVEQTRTDLLERARASHASALASARDACTSTSVAISRVEEVHSRLSLLRPRPPNGSWGPVAEPLESTRP